MKALLFIAILTPLSAIAQAAVTFTNTFSSSTLIPDNNSVGYATTQTLTAGSGNTPATGNIDTITSVTVALDFVGGWNGDLYVYLVHDTGFSVLLNRIGRDAANLDGSATSGLSIILADDALTNIHQPSVNSGSLTGTYRPDGRITDPGSVLTSDDPTAATLANFNGLNPLGNWTLFVADLGPGEQSTLQSWSLTITAVPEPNVALLCLIGALPFLRRRRSSDAKTAAAQQRRLK